MLKCRQSPRMFELGVSASVTKLRRASKMEFDVHGMCGSIKMLSTQSLYGFGHYWILHRCDKRDAQAALLREAGHGGLILNFRLGL